MPNERTLEEPGLDQTAGERDQTVRSAVDTNPAGSPSIADELASIVQTGSNQPTQATLINPTTGDKRVVTSGSEEAQQLFGQGYALMGPDGQPVAAAGGSTAPTDAAPAPPGATTPTPRFDPRAEGNANITGLRDKATELKAQAFEAVYNFTPEEWQNQPPSVQRQLRNQRVRTLARQLGSVEQAINVAKDEMDAAENKALETLNTYIQFGVLSELGDDQLRELAISAGYDPTVVSKIAELAGQPEPPELRSIGGDLYAVAFNSETGQFETTLVQAGRRSGGGGGSSTTTEEVQPPSNAELEFYASYLAGDVLFQDMTGAEQSIINAAEQYYSELPPTDPPFEPTDKQLGKTAKRGFDKLFNR